MDVPERTQSSMFGTIELLLAAALKALLTAVLKPTFPLLFTDNSNGSGASRVSRPTPSSHIVLADTDTNSDKMGSTGGPVALNYFPKQQQDFKPPLIANENAFLGDVATSESNDPKAPISCGFYRLEKGTPLVYEYTYHEMKIILEGSFDISDETGKEVHATKGDVFYFPKGSKITFKTEDYGLAFYTGQRKEGAA